MVRNRPKTNSNTAKDTRISGRRGAAPTTKGRNVLGTDLEFTLSVWDGKKHVEVDPEEFFRSRGIVRVSKSEEKPKTVRWKKRAGKLKRADRIIIKDSIVSTLKQVENAEERQNIFNSVATDLGLAPAQTPEDSAEELATDPSPSASVSLPAEAPAIYRERSDPTETAEQFLRRTYEPWLTAGCLFQFHVGKLDPSLLQGLKNQFKGRAEELRAILPIKKDAVSQRLAALVGKEIDDPAQRRLLAQAERNMSYMIRKLKP